MRETIKIKKSDIENIDIFDPPGCEYCGNEFVLPSITTGLHKIPVKDQKGKIYCDQDCFTYHHNADQELIEIIYEVVE